MNERQLYETQTVWQALWGFNVYKTGLFYAIYYFPAHPDLTYHPP